MKRYPNIPNTSSLAEIVLTIQHITRLRNEDISEIDNFQNIYMRGRKVSKIPTGSSDISDSKVGDFNYDTSYFYICVDNAGTATWRRVAIGSW